MSDLGQGLGVENGEDFGGGQHFDQPEESTEADHVGEREDIADADAGDELEESDEEASAAADGEASAAADGEASAAADGEASAAPDEERVPSLTPPQQTGDTRVDEALARLAGLDDLPLAAQVTVFDDVHRLLQDALTASDAVSAPGAPAQ